VNFAGGFLHVEDEDRQDPVRFDMTLAPVVFAGSAHSEKLSLSWDKNILVLSNESGIAKLEEGTGRFLGASLHDKISGTAHWEQGGFSQAKKSLIDPIGQRNYRDPKRPLSSLLTFLTCEWLHLKSAGSPEAKTKTERALAVLQKLQDKGILDPLDKLWAAETTDKSEVVIIPVDYPENAASVLETATKALAAEIFLVSDKLFPAGSWPWATTREAVYVFGNKGQYTQLELKRLYESDQMGPIGFWTISQLLAWTKLPFSQKFAERGLGRLTSADFRKDWQLILGSNTPFSACLAQILRAAKDLPDEDIDALAGVCQSGTAILIRGAVQSLRVNQNKPAAEVLAPLLDVLWEKNLRITFESALKTLQQSSPAK
jgi:hypothetical protein